MILTVLSKDSLLARFDKLVGTERKITHLVLQCIAEIDRRQLHLEMAYPSLFEFLTQAYGYSAGAAQRRINAARLLREVPEVALKIEEGKLTLSQIALATQSIRLAEKKFATPMELEDKLELLERIESHNFVETQKILAQELKIEGPSPERVQHHADGSVTISMTLTSEQYETWCRAGELASHSVPNRKHADLALYLAEKEISRRTEIKRAFPQRKNPSRRPRQIAPNLRKHILAGVTPDKSKTQRIRFGLGTSDSEVSHGLGRAIDGRLGPVTSDSEVKPQVGCTYVDSRTGKRCGSRHFLQVDHIHEVRNGGSNDPQNLRALCANHNRWR